MSTDPVPEDIVTRLRHGFHCPCEHWGHERECEIHQAFVDAQLRQAADEIERLRDEVGRLRRGLQLACEEIYMDYYNEGELPEELFARFYAGKSWYQLIEEAIAAEKKKKGRQRKQPQKK